LPAGYRKLSLLDDLRGEHVIDGNGAVDLVAANGGRRIAVEVETGKSDINANLAKVKDAGFDEVLVLATSPSAVAACHKAIQAAGATKTRLLTWLDIP
jgi:predicted RecB family endonuclease